MYIFHFQQIYQKVDLLTTQIFLFYTAKMNKYFIIKLAFSAFRIKKSKKKTEKKKIIKFAYKMHSIEKAN